MRSILSTLAMLITFSAPISAAEFFVLPGTKTLLMMGETKSSDVRILSDHILKDSIDTLILKGPGGDLAAGYGLANLVLQHGINVIVPKNTKCASACSIIFSAGRIREMEERSFLGFHLPFLINENPLEYCSQLIAYTEDKPVDIFSGLSMKIDPKCLMYTYQMGLKDIRKIRRYVVRDGISENILNLMINTPSDGMAWVNRENAVNYGLVNKK